LTVCHAQTGVRAGNAPLGVRYCARERATGLRFGARFSALSVVVALLRARMLCCHVCGSFAVVSTAICGRPFWPPAPLSCRWPGGCGWSG
jgi:hypothetical protein